MKPNETIKTKEIKTDSYGIFNVNLKMFIQNDKEYYLLTASNTKGKKWYDKLIIYNKIYKNKKRALQRFVWLDKNFIYDKYYKKDIEMI